MLRGNSLSTKFANTVIWDPAITELCNVTEDVSCEQKMGESDRFITIRGGRLVARIKHPILIGVVEITIFGFGHIIQEQGFTNIRGNPRVMGNHMMVGVEQTHQIVQEYADKKSVVEGKVPFHEGGQP
eukprot:11778675-Ditylum_brightwellii.AAC.1